MEACATFSGRLRTREDHILPEKRAVDGWKHTQRPEPGSLGNLGYSMDISGLCLWCFMIVSDITPEREQGAGEMAQQ